MTSSSVVGPFAFRIWWRCSKLRSPEKRHDGHMSEGFRLWWVAMEPYVLPLAVAFIGLILALVAGRLLFKKGK